MRNSARNSPVNAPKSSLDGARDSILRAGAQRNAEIARRFRIATSEELDAVGLVKRAGGKPDQFIPIINVALGPWLDVAEKQFPNAFKKLWEACSKIGLSSAPAPKSFQFDASIMLRDRWLAVFEEQSLEHDGATGTAAAALEWGDENVAPLLKMMGEPFPYVACIVADGDQMGHAIDKCENPEQHRALSRALNAFAENASIIVKRNGGSLVYAGGDDVLAFAPLTSAVACAAELASAFQLELANVPGRNSESQPRPTLSVGIGVGHVMESMGHLLDLGRKGEQLAKQKRNSLAVVADKRSGGRLEWLASWEDDPKAQLVIDVEALNDLDVAEIPSRKIYEIKSICERFPAKVEEREDADWAKFLRLEVRRAIRRADVGNPLDFGPGLSDGESYADSRYKVERWVSRTLIARLLASATPSLKGEA